MPKGHAEIGAWRQLTISHRATARQQSTADLESQSAGWQPVAPRWSLRFAYLKIILSFVGVFDVTDEKILDVT